MNETVLVLDEQQTLALRDLAAAVVALDADTAAEFEEVSGGLSLLDAISLGQMFLDLTCKATGGCPGYDGWPGPEHSPFQHGA